MKPFKMDFHSHSHFSNDSKTPMEDMVKKAIALDVTHMAFTEHVDFDADPELGYPDWNFDQEKYMDTIEHLNLKYKTDIRLYIAAEIGLQKQVSVKNRTLCQKYPFDFILGSQHTLDGEDIYRSHHFLSKDYKNAIKRYFESYYENILAYEDFDTLGHLDLFLRYHKDAIEVPFNVYSDYVEALLKKLIEMGKGIELNAGGYRYGLNQNNPTVDYLKLYRALGGEIITLGSDAHSPEYVADHYDENCAQLRQLGFKYITYFEKRQPKFISLTKG